MKQMKKQDIVEMKIQKYYPNMNENVKFQHISQEF